MARRAAYKRPKKRAARAVVDYVQHQWDKIGTPEGRAFFYNRKAWEGYVVQTILRLQSLGWHPRDVISPEIIKALVALEQPLNFGITPDRDGMKKHWIDVEMKALAILQHEFDMPDHYP